MIKLIVNGKPCELKKPLKLQEYLDSLGIKIRFVAVARNGHVLNRRDFKLIDLNDGDVLEIVKAIGGGMTSDIH